MGPGRCSGAIKGSGRGPAATRAPWVRRRLTAVPAREGGRVRRVHLLATGGTIASRRGPDGLAAVTPAVELPAGAGPLGALSVTTSALGPVGSFAFTTPALGRRVAEARRCLGAGVDGVVVTQG